jgi:hypothetical protein
MASDCSMEFCEAVAYGPESSGWIPSGTDSLVRYRRNPPASVVAEYVESAAARPPGSSTTAPVSATTAASDAIRVAYVIGGIYGYGG